MFKEKGGRGKSDKKDGSVVRVLAENSEDWGSVSSLLTDFLYDHGQVP